MISWDGASPTRPSNCSSALDALIIPVKTRSPLASVVAAEEAGDDREAGVSGELPSDCSGSRSRSPT